jgi:hypothetical protein
MKRDCPKKINLIKCAGFKGRENIGRKKKRVNIMAIG